MAGYTLVLAVACCLLALVHSSPFEQKTTFELKERHDFFNPRNSNPFSSAADARLKTQSARIEHDFIGGKDWAAGAYAQHQRQTMLGQSRRNNEGGLQFKMNFRR